MGEPQGGVHVAEQRELRINTLTTLGMQQRLIRLHREETSESELQPEM